MAFRLVEQGALTRPPVIVALPPPFTIRKPEKKPLSRQKPNTACAVEPAPQTEKWACQNCTFLNEFPSNICEVCAKSKNFIEAQNNSYFECPRCTFINPPLVTHCEMCATELEGLQDRLQHLDDSSDDDLKVLEPLS